MNSVTKIFIFIIETVNAKLQNKTSTIDVLSHVTGQIYITREMIANRQKQIEMVTFQRIERIHEGIKSNCLFYSLIVYKISWNRYLYELKRIGYEK